LIVFKNILALDMACGEIAVCVLHGENTFFNIVPSLPDQGKMRSTMIVPLMEEVLSQAGLVWSALDGLALGAGPGSFTGIRIAAATLAGINSALKLPIMHLSSLAITAAQTNTDRPLWVLEDARVGEVFVGCYDDGLALQRDACMRWDDVEAKEIADYCCHAEPQMNIASGVRQPLQLSRSAALALVMQSVAKRSIPKQTCDWPNYPSPVYLQVSQAERNLNAGS